MDNALKMLELRLESLKNINYKPWKRRILLFLKVKHVSLLHFKIIQEMQEIEGIKAVKGFAS